MKVYFFALGTNHTLCKIDIVNFLFREKVEFEILASSEELLIVKLGKELEIEKAMEVLGSAAKVGEILKICSEKNWEGEFLKEGWWKGLNKEKFGVSVYLAGGKFKALNKVFRTIGDLAKKIRQEGQLKEIKRRGRILSTVAVKENGLLENGVEIVVGVGSGVVYLGRTLAIQNYEDYSFRDYGRPRRNPRVGMLPPKLAKIMINLAGREKDELLLDPFCGRGTILQEMILLGYRRIRGLDVDGKAIEDCKKNLEWLFRNYGLPKERFDLKVVEGRAQEAGFFLGGEKVAGIITEPYLGRPLRKFLGEKEILKERENLEKHYLDFLKEFKEVLKEDGVIVMIFPVFRLGKRFFYLEILEEIERIGLRKMGFLRGKVKGVDLGLNVTERGSIVYFRVGQRVSREIFVFGRV